MSQGDLLSGRYISFFVGKLHQHYALAGMSVRERKQLNGMRTEDRLPPILYHGTWAFGLLLFIQMNSRTMQLIARFSLLLPAVALCIANVHTTLTTEHSRSLYLKIGQACRVCNTLFAITLLTLAVLIDNPLSSGLNYPIIIIYTSFCETVVTILMFFRSKQKRNGVTSCQMFLMVVGVLYLLVFPSNLLHLRLWRILLLVLGHANLLLPVFRPSTTEKLFDANVGFVGVLIISGVLFGVGTTPWPGFLFWILLGISELLAERMVFSRQWVASNLAMKVR